MSCVRSFFSTRRAFCPWVGLFSREVEIWSGRRSFSGENSKKEAWGKADGLGGRPLPCVKTTFPQPCGRYRSQSVVGYGTSSAAKTLPLSLGETASDRRSSISFLWIEESDRYAVQFFIFHISYQFFSWSGAATGKLSPLRGDDIRGKRFPSPLFSCRQRCSVSVGVPHRVCKYQ